MFEPAIKCADRLGALFGDSNYFHHTAIDYSLYRVSKLL